MNDPVLIRPTTHADIAAVDLLLATSYPALLKADYPPSVLVTALPIISRARPELLVCGTYYAALRAGKIVGAGGWTLSSPEAAKTALQTAHVRHFVTDHRVTRQGIASALMGHCLSQARAAGVVRMVCQATRTALPFYQRMGFVGQREISVPLDAGINFPAIVMEQYL
ncbi:MAG: GNAT superfamily N-acetyltransferase [Dinoroseobacter sp.]|jgi:GNAT superfamily N-acetyltransferase